LLPMNGLIMKILKFHMTVVSNMKLVVSIVMKDFALTETGNVHKRILAEPAQLLLLQEDSVPEFLNILTLPLQNMGKLLEQKTSKKKFSPEDLWQQESMPVLF